MPTLDPLLPNTVIYAEDRELSDDFSGGVLDTRNFPFISGQDDPHPVGRWMWTNPGAGQVIDFDPTPTGGIRVVPQFNRDYGSVRLAYRGSGSGKLNLTDPGYQTTFGVLAYSMKIVSLMRWPSGSLFSGGYYTLFVDLSEAAETLSLRGIAFQGMTNLDVGPFFDFPGEYSHLMSGIQIVGGQQGGGVFFPITYKIRLVLNVKLRVGEVAAEIQDVSCRRAARFPDSGYRIPPNG